MSAEAQDYIPLEEAEAGAVLAGLGSFTLCASDPPWSALAARLPAPARLIRAEDMDADHLEGLLRGEPDTRCVVGFGGGAALDTAKFVAWRTGKALVQIPTITSVDAAFTDAVGVRRDGKVRYVGKVLAERVVLDVDLVRSAPARLNRAGIGDVLSCHTGLWDWRAAVRAGHGPAWDEHAAALGLQLLRELAAHADAVAAVDTTAVRWLASAYQRIGAMCHRVGHSCFEEGSEHYFAYAYEHLTGAHPLHGELVALGVFVMSRLQGNSPDAVQDLLVRSRIVCHPAELGLSEDDFRRTFAILPDYVRGERLGYSIVNESAPDAATVRALWQAACTLPRRTNADGASDR
ncbi:MAG: iron-containing alcohol dehydrogenase [Pseudomonadales bacterium]|nr:iron-containing alcohol dehydrogenase [Pseudomonadales bacterium]